MNFEKPEKWEFWKKWKKLLEISSFYRYVPKTTIIWGTVPEIRSETIFFLILGHFFALYDPLRPPPHLTSQKTKYLKKWKKNLELSSFCATKNMIKWSMFTQILSVTNIIFALLPHYWPQKLKFGENVKSTWRYYPLTHVHHKSRSHDEWFMRYKLQRPKILSFWAIFFSLIFLKTQKIKILKI